MRSQVIVVVTPCLDRFARLGEREGDVLVEAFVAQATVEALDEGVLHRLARLDVVPVETSSGPAQDRGSKGSEDLQSPEYDMRLRGSMTGGSRLDSKAKFSLARRGRSSLPALEQRSPECSSPPFRVPFRYQNKSQTIAEDAHCGRHGTVFEKARVIAPYRVQVARRVPQISR